MVQRDSRKQAHFIQRQKAARAHALATAEGPHRATRREVTPVQQKAVRHSPWQETPCDKRIGVREYSRVAVELHNEEDTVTRANMRGSALLNGGKALEGEAYANAQE